MRSLTADRIRCSHPSYLARTNPFPSANCRARISSAYTTSSAGQSFRPAWTSPRLRNQRQSRGALIAFFRGLSEAMLTIREERDSIYDNCANVALESGKNEVLDESSQCGS